jgi:uncharacterized repeat protein (TIGR01451 family)
MKIKNIITVFAFLSFLVLNTEQVCAQGGIFKKMKDKLQGEENTSSASVADLSLTLSVNNSNACPGSTVIFVILVHNSGPALATGIKVKDKIPDGYTYISSSTVAGSYDNSSGIWDFDSLVKDRFASLTIEATVNGAGDFMNLAEIIASDQEDPDSKPADGVDTDKDGLVVDDPDDDDDGDGQDIKCLKSFNQATTNINIDAPGITAFLEDRKKRNQTYVFDAKTIAMRVEFDKKDKQKPMFFDKAGYVYTASKKDEYVKVPFEKLKNLMNFSTFASRGVLPPIDFPDGSVTYYGMDVSPKRFPILEWAFVYKVQHFEGNPDFNKEILDCRGDSNCIKYILKTGEGAGSYVLFDSKKRLAEIFTTKTGNIVYTYQDNNVQLPNAQEMPFMSDMFNNN